MIEGSDYGSGSYMVNFNAGVTRVSFNVSILDNNILENDETFILTIEHSSLPNNVDVGTPNETKITIVDDDGKYVDILLSFYNKSLLYCYILCVCKFWMFMFFIYY